MLDRTRYPLSRAARAQAVGILAILTGLGVLGVLSLELAGADALRLVVVVVTVLLAIGLAVAAVRLVRAPTVLELSADGYRVRGLRGVGVRHATWREVHDVASQDRAGESLVVVRLLDGERSTCLPVRLVDAPVQTWLRDLDQRLDAAHGQRRLR